MLKYVNFDIVFQEIPDEVTLAVNISNCPNRCPGCHSPWLREDIGDLLTASAIDGMIGPYLGDITCVCFMGGDGDPGEVARIAAHVKDTYPKDEELDKPGIKTAWYSGCAELPKGFDLKYLDFVKLGPYIESLGGLKSPSTNQKLFRIVPVEDQSGPTQGKTEEEISPDGRYRMVRMAMPRNFLE
ncbi:MAG: anaerobic ribonucleoside-triphosphate reductase activating protein [Bacteroidales bacterium]|jgi:anaerobic ribonucleoside-triphosphate reductase activating protein|nr:anaerobic ribonucleoside-triphosphate reductase activating protein [Bacteroidales bacterium]MCI2146240.1 anaerobic ribonucleoside-triphosphate reductase activating protein [Bacteroidales bacterium]